MSRNTEITKAAVTPMVEYEPAEPLQPEQAPNVLKQAHGLLRGRYWLAITLCVIGLGIGGFFGFRLAQPLYQSTGLIRVTPYQPPILYETEQTGSMPGWDAFVSSQVELIQGERVLDLAMQDPKWTAVGRGMEPAQVVAFRESLTVARPKGSELIAVSFEDADREIARVAVEAVLTAYNKLYGEAGDEGVLRRMGFLETRRGALEADLKSLNDRIFAIGNELGSGAIDQIYQGKLAELMKLESELRRVELEVAIARGVAASVQQAGGEGTEAAPLGTEPGSIEALARHVPEVQELLNSRRMLERQLRIDAERLGPTHPAIQTLRAQLDVINEELEEAVAIYRDLGFGPQDVTLPPAAPGMPAMTLAQLEARERNVRTLYQAAEAETKALGRKTIEIDALRLQARDVQGKLDETKQRLEALTVERQLGGRISIASFGDRPLSPSKDKRKQFAAAGAMGLGGAGVGLVMLLGLLDRRVRTVADVQDGLKRTRLLGVLPLLPADLSDPEQALLAAHSVHQIRTSLNGRNSVESKQVFTITSPSPDSGKTSLSLALGLSFAASRSRTLLIDCDFIGGGLTAKMKKITRRRLGHVLRRQGVITTPQLVEALKLRTQNHALLGEVLVQLGYATQEEVDEALEIQRESLVGLREAMLGDPPQECFTESGTSGLYVMPLGSAGRQHVGELSYPALATVIEQVRRWFDVIIIDTGPILGSLEASVAAMVADEVVLTVVRGEDRGHVEKSLEQLSTLGASVAGVVLNRATMPDIIASGYSSSISRLSGDHREFYPEQLPVVDHKHLRLGPIGSAVASISGSVQSSDEAGEE